MSAQLDLTLPDPATRFDGVTYSPELDAARLTGQLLNVYACMAKGGWVTLQQIAHVADCSEASASARIRDLRKAKWGSHIVDRKRIDGGLFAYRLVLP